MGRTPNITLLTMAFLVPTAKARLDRVRRRVSASINDPQDTKIGASPRESLATAWIVAATARTEPTRRHSPACGPPRACNNQEEGVGAVRQGNRGEAVPG